MIKDLKLTINLMKLTLTSIVINGQDQNMGVYCHAGLIFLHLNYNFEFKSKPCRIIKVLDLKSKL